LKLVWSDLAIQRAEEAAEFIARDKPEAARKWLEGLFRSVDRLQNFPESGHVLPEVGLPEYREIAYRSHRVIYKLHESTIVVLTIRHSKQLFDSDEITDNPSR